MIESQEGWTRAIILGQYGFLPAVSGGISGSKTDVADPCSSCGRAIHYGQQRRYIGIEDRWNDRRSRVVCLGCAEEKSR